MRIESLARLIDGEILNFPSITYIDQLKIDVKQIKRADAFICNDENDVDNAIKNGAYAIISEKRFQITDDEIAWIVVDDIKKAIIRYLRFKTVQSRANFFLCDNLTYEILRDISPADKVIVLNDDIFQSFLQIVNASEEMIFIGKNRKLLSGIYPPFLEIEDSRKNFIKIIKNTLFSIDFIYNEQYYKEIHLPYLFKSHLNKAINFLEKHSLEIAFEKLILKKHFYPIFVDNFLRIKDFGQTNKVLIEETDEMYLQNEINYLVNYAKYAKNTLIVPDNSFFHSDKIDVLKYQANDIESLVKLFQKDYNFFLILNKGEKDILTSIKNINQKKTKRSLF